jgi:hypothetical protein
MTLALRSLVLEDAQSLNGAVRVSSDPERIVEALALWQARKENAEVRVADDD